MIWFNRRVKAGIMNSRNDCCGLFQCNQWIPGNNEKNWNLLLQLEVFCFYGIFWALILRISKWIVSEGGCVRVCNEITTRKNFFLARKTLNCSHFSTWFYFSFAFVTVEIWHDLSSTENFQNSKSIAYLLLWYSSSTTVKFPFPISEKTSFRFSGLIPTAVAVLELE